MKLPLGRPGISLFLFVALTLLFNWPLLSIPASDGLFGWLFCAWGLAIALLFLAAHGSCDEEVMPVPPGFAPGSGPGPDPSPAPAPAGELKQGGGASPEDGDV
ncbi:MAG: hypothetical protein KKF77_13720 [Proteobacteria bacterium]|nr:hypothetical protein [Pseudomonadota bacterium]